MALQVLSLPLLRVLLQVLMLVLLLRLDQGIQQTMLLLVLELDMLLLVLDLYVLPLDLFGWII